MVKQKEHLDKRQVERAAQALLKHIAVEAGKKSTKSLLGDDGDEMITLLVALRKIPKSSQAKPIKIAIPRSIYRSDSNGICLICKDPQKTFKARIASEHISDVKKVIGISKLRTNYKPYEAKRNLCGSYELFVVDDRVMPLLPPLIGKTFYRAKKQPIPLKLNVKNLEKEIASVRDSTYLYMPSGPSCSVRVARASFTPEQIALNVIAAADGVAKHISGKWEGIQALYIKTSSSVALPVYTSLPSAALKIPVEDEDDVSSDEDHAADDEEIDSEEVSGVESD